MRQINVRRTRAADSTYRKLAVQWLNEVLFSAYAGFSACRQFNASQLPTSCSCKPRGIYISRGYKPTEFEIINRNHKTCFNLTGLSVWNKKENLFQPIKLHYQSDGLTKIEIDNPEYFHQVFDLNLIQRNRKKNIFHNQMA